MTPDGSAGMRAGLTIPMLVIAAVFVASLLWTTMRAVQDQRTLAAATENQSRAVQEGERLRGQLDGLLAGATTLATGGNAPAKAALEALVKEGIKYTPPLSAP